MAFNDGTGYWLHVWIAPGLGGLNFSLFYSYFLVISCLFPDGEREIHGRLARYDGIPIGMQKDETEKKNKQQTKTNKHRRRFHH